jgi:uncharacterized membrane protein YozB (DUF420 family)
MNCPKCNQQNPDEAKICSSCGSTLSSPPPKQNKIDVKTSELAVTSCILGILTILTFAFWLSLVAHDDTSSEVLAIISVVAGALSLILGIAGLVCIEKSNGRLTGRAFAAIGIAIPVVLFFLGQLLMVARGSINYRMYCSTNLSGIGKAMLIYSNDYDDELPRAAGRNSKWGTTPDWQADTRSAAYGLTNNANGQASISASFYLLVKYTEITSKSFLCKGDRKTTEFIPAKYGVRNKELTDLWDFGPDPSKHCSYSYHIPYGPYPLTISSDPAMAVAADRNPWLPSPGAKRRNFKAFDPNGPREAINAGNTVFHKEDGQNVLLMDGHSVFERSSACGLDDDNIYTSWSGSDIKKGSIPTLKSQPADPNDSLLVHDPPLTDQK